MLEIIFFVLMIMVFGKIGMFALRASWGLAKIVLAVVFLPLTLIFMVLRGLLAIAFPVLAIIGLISLFGGRR